MLLAHDIDDTVLQFSDPMQDFLASKGLIIETRLRDHHNIPELFGLSIEDTIQLIGEFHHSPIMGKLQPEPCAAIVLPELHRRGYRFVAISACVDDPIVHALRVQNLEAAFGFQWEAVHCVGLLNEKEDMLRSYAPGIWVEDVWNHALAGHRAGHYTYLLDRPYNQVDEHIEITRVKDWYQIYKELTY